MLARQIAVERVVVVAKEGARAAVAALGDVMRQAGKHCSREARHGGSIFVSDPADGN